MINNSVLLILIALLSALSSQLAFSQSPFAGTYFKKNKKDTMAIKEIRISEEGNAMVIDSQNKEHLTLVKKIDDETLRLFYELDDNTPQFVKIQLKRKFAKVTLSHNSDLLSQIDSVIFKRKIKPYPSVPSLFMESK